jgi:ankyrin repeat protein
MKTSSDSLALSMNIASGKFETVTKLLKEGVDPNSTTDKKTPMLFLALNKKNLNIFNALLEHGANPNITSNEMPIISIAVINGDIDFVDALIKHKADVNMVDKTGLNPCYYALLKEDNFKMQELLLKNNGYPLFSYDKGKNFLLKKNMEELLKSRKDGSTTYLHKLAKSKEADDFVRLEQMLDYVDHHKILDAKAEMRYKVKITESEFEMREISNVTPLYLAVNSVNLNTTRLLVDYGANVDCATSIKKLDKETDKLNEEDFYSIFELALYKALEPKGDKKEFEILKIIADKAKFPQSERFKRKVIKDFKKFPEEIQNLLIKKFPKEFSLDLILEGPSLAPLIKLEPLQLQSTIEATSSDPLIKLETLKLTKSTILER